MLRPTPTRKTFRVVVTCSWILGGVTIWTHEFANQLSKRGHEVTCIFVSPGLPFLKQPPPLPDGGYRAIRLRARPWSFLQAVPRFLNAYLCRNPVDVIVSKEAEGTYLSTSRMPHGLPHVAVISVPEPTYTDAKRLLWSSLALVPRMMRTGLRGGESLGEKLMPWYWDWVHYLSGKRLAQASLVVPVSHIQGRAVQQAWRIAEAKIWTIHDGIDTERFRPSGTRSTDEERRLLFVGGANPRKGADVFLEAFARVSRYETGVFADLVGGGDWTVQRRKAEGLGISSRIHFLQFVPHHEMPGYFARCFALVAPSKSESFGRAVAEAMACGLPVVATRVGSIPEIVQNGVTGLLVPGNDAQALAHAILELTRNPRRAEEMGRAGRARVEREFSWDVITPQWETLFQLLHERANPQGTLSV